MNSIVTVTEEAMNEIERLYTEAKETASGLRVAVVGGGCAGFQYALGFDDADDDDLVVELNPVNVIIDPSSLPYLQGSVIGWTGGLGGSGFSVDNPNSTGGCGCGKSFSADDNDDASDATPEVSEGCSGCEHA